MTIIENLDLFQSKIGRSKNKLSDLNNSPSISNFILLISFIYYFSVSGIINGFSELSQYYSCPGCRVKVDKLDDACWRCEDNFEKPTQDFRFVVELSIGDDCKSYLGFKKCLFGLITFEEQEESENAEVELLLNENLEGKKVFVSFKNDDAYEGEEDPDPIVLSMKLLEE